MLSRRIIRSLLGGSTIVKLSGPLCRGNVKFLWNEGKYIRKKCNLEFRKCGIKDYEWSKIPEKCRIKEWEWWLWFRTCGIKESGFWTKFLFFNSAFFCFCFAGLGLVWISSIKVSFRFLWLWWKAAVHRYSSE